MTNEFTPRDAQSRAFTSAKRAVKAAAKDAPTLQGEGSRAVEAWFLGPKAENADLFEALITEAIRDHVYWRRNYHPGDPTHITAAIKRGASYGEAVDLLEEGFRGLLAFLKKSVPFFSMRYQGHMIWELTLPGMLGYFSAMLYNPNNVAFEASTATTILELLASDDICRMLGYQVPYGPSTGTTTVRPWGHITCDGTVANIEAIWAARNLKYYALAVRQALRRELKAAASLTVPLPDGQMLPLVDLTTWQALNVPQDAVLALAGRIAEEFHVPPAQVADAIASYSPQTLGMARFARELLADLPHDPVVLVPGTKHYSFPKAAAILGLGASNLIDVPVDLDARQDIGELRRRLDQCLEERRPVIAAVAVVGTTEESAIDPLADVLALRDEYSKRGLVFHVHADAAWGGYHRSVINDAFDLSSPAQAAFTAAPLQVPLSAHSVRHLTALSGADSITVDPHKSGYIPYPAGALCYRNGALRNLVTFSAPVVFHGEAEPSVGIYGVEGSKPGAAAAAVYLSHRVIRPTRDGYGRIIGQALFSCRKLYARLLTMRRPDDPFIVIPVPRTPAERRGADAKAVEQEIAEIRARIDQQDTDAIRGDAAAMALLAEIGPDENILSYAFNLVQPDGTINSSLELANKLNKGIYDRLSIKPGADIYQYDLLVSTTDFAPAAYGSRFIDSFCQRLGVAPGKDSITVLRSVVMDPWVTETVEGSFIDVIERELRKAVMQTIKQLSASNA